MNYKGNKKLVVVCLYIPEGLSEFRMKKRGDAPKKMQERLENDKKSFSSKSLSKVADIVLRSDINELPNLTLELGCYLNETSLSDV